MFYYLTELLGIDENGHYISEERVYGYNHKATLLDRQDTREEMHDWLEKIYGDCEILSVTWEEIDEEEVDNGGWDVW